MILFLSINQETIINTEIQKLALQESAIDATTITLEPNEEEASTTMLIYHATHYMLIAAEKKIPYPQNQVIKLSITNNWT